MSQVYLFLTDKQSDAVMNVYSGICNAAAPEDSVYLLFHHKGEALSSRLQALCPFLFTYQSLIRLNYMPIVWDIIPGSNHFPLLQFFHSYPGYTQYWLIEDDVRFSGDWRSFFTFFNLYDHDFISSHIRTFSQEPEWSWWDSLTHAQKTIPFHQRLRSFNPIYRISQTALQFIHTALSDKWVGHHEVLLPTLLYRNGYRISDFGGEGDFVAPGNKNMFYTSSISDPKGGMSEGTMRFRPVWENIGSENNKLYHPIKARTTGLYLPTI